MSNLLIIGNGFDMKHGLQTGYDSFKDYLEIKKKSCSDFDSVLNYQIKYNTVL